MKEEGRATREEVEESGVKEQRGMGMRGGRERLVG